MAALFRRFVVPVFFTFLICTCLAAQTPDGQQNGPLPSQSTSKEDPQRQKALDLYHAGKFVEAMPLLEQLVADHPDDIAVRESLAFSILGRSATLNDPELRKKARARGRAIALQAQQLGDHSDLLQIMLSVPEDGSEAAFSDRKEVDEAMKAAEANFVRGDFDKARDGYLHALMLDPNDYEAALFIGDVYFKQHINGSAGEWFGRAIQINPNRETAHRYWGDALWDMGKSTEAREKYIQAIVAEPYNQRSWMGLTKWAQQSKVALNWIRLQDKSSVAQKDDSHINITLDAGSLGKNDPAGSAWLVYGMNRALWQQEKFKKEFPKEAVYRHSMREEVESLQMMVSVMTGQKDFNRKKKNLDPALLQLIQVDQAGFMEPFALLNRADKDIAQDYVPYRDAHRETVTRYFEEYVVPKSPQP